MLAAQTGGRYHRSHGLDFNADLFAHKVLNEGFTDEVLIFVFYRVHARHHCSTLFTIFIPQLFSEQILSRQSFFVETMLWSVITPITLDSNWTAQIISDERYQST